MNYEQEQQIVSEIKKYVTDYLPLSKISDEELEKQVEKYKEELIASGIKIK